MEQLLDVRLSADAGAVVVTAAGEVDMTSAPLLAEGLERAHDLVPAPRAVVADLSGVTFLAAAGLAVLLAAHRACDERGVPLSLVASNRVVLRPLELCDLTSVLRVAAEPPVPTGDARARHDDDLAPTDDVVARPVGDRGRAGPESPLAIALVAAAWETEPAEHRAHISDLADALHRQGHRVALHIRRTSADLPGSERTRSGFEVVRVAAGPPTPLSTAGLLPHLDAFADALDREWAERVPDVVHLHSWPSGLAVRETAFPLVQSFHGTDPAEGVAGLDAGRLEEWGRLTALAADRVVAASGDEVFALMRSGVARARVSLVPWGLDIDAFGPGGPVAPRGDAPRVVALGEVVRHSGFDTAVEALASVPGVELLVVGPIRSPDPREDPEVTRLVRLAREHDVAHRLRFTGQVGRADLPALLRSADVVVRVPTREPSGIGALQAMACGVPVVATAVGALADIVIDGVTGVLVPPRDPWALGQALRGVLADPVRREVFAITGADRARARYSWDRVVAEVVDTYRKTVATVRNTRLRTRVDVCGASEPSR